MLRWDNIYIYICMQITTCFKRSRVQWCPLVSLVAFYALLYRQGVFDICPRRTMLWDTPSRIIPSRMFSNVSSLAPGIFQYNFRWVISKLILLNGGWGISYEVALRWLPLDLTNDKLRLVHGMTWCHQATSYNLSQCWPRPMSPNGVTRPQWVKANVQLLLISPPHNLVIYSHSIIQFLLMSKVWNP